LIHQTARGDGFGELIAQGALRLAENYGVPDLAVQVNGLEVAYHDPRGASGMALVYATSPRGACHNQSDYFIVEIGQSVEEIGVEFHSRQAGPEKAASVVRHQDWRTLGNSLVICQFANVEPAEVVRLIKYSTGFDLGLDQVMQAGERIWNLKRVINHRLGLTAGDDKIPRLLLDAYDDGGAAGYVPPFQEMLCAYYGARGWDPETGKPGKSRLRELGLERESRDIW
jgi:aldehyde:ferredoxin oxidoreductase